MSPKHSFKESAQLKNRILNFIINNSGDYGVSELADIFGIEKRTVQYFVGDYNEKGFIIKSRKNKYNVFAYPENFKTFKRVIDAEQLKKWIVYDYLKDCCRNGNAVHMDIFSKIVCENNSSITDKSSYIFKLLRKLQDEGYVKIEKGKVIPVKNPFYEMSEDELKSLLIYLNIIKNYFPSSVILHQIFFKFKLIYEKKFSKKFDRRLAVFAHKHKISTYDDDHVMIIEKALSEGRCVNFTYKLKMSIKHVKDVPKGLIYNNWKDAWYLVCGTERESIYRVDKIVDLNLGDVIEDYGKFPFDKELYSVSLGAVNEPIYEVEVHFVPKEFILRKLKQYCSMRKYAELMYEEECCILKDKVSGLHEFKKWVRSFGYGAKCIKPAELAESIVNDINLMKERYGINSG